MPADSSPVWTSVPLRDVVRLMDIRLTIPAALIAALALGGCSNSGSDAESSVRTPATSRVHAAGITLSLPRGWHRARKNLTPNLARPRDLLSVGTLPMRAQSSACAQLPRASYREMGPDDGMITILENPGGDFGPRPKRFDLKPRWPSFECLVRPLVGQELTFEQAGRRFYAFVALGKQGPERQAEAILDSMRVQPSP
jgi:hypothetical protein